MPSLYRVGTAIARRAAKLLYGADADCCCGVDCGCDCTDFPCCNPSVEFALGADALCSNPPANPNRMTGQWLWNGCTFTWNLSFGSTGGITMEGAATYAANSGCNAPVGVWTAGTYGNDGEFALAPDVPTRRCQNDNATVTIAKTATGYSFTVAGVTDDPDNPCDGTCQYANATWLVEC